jgi:hypothetical protein
MKKRWLAISAGVGAASALVAVAVVGYMRRERPESARLRDLRALHESLQTQLAGHLNAEPLLQEDFDSGELTVAIRTPYLGKIIREVSRRYLDRVQLDLAPDLRVRESGEVKTKMLGTSVTLGEWSVDIRIARLMGVLGAETPDLSVAEQNKVRVEMPVRLVSAMGSGTLQFRWDSRSMTNLVCKDFEVEEDLQATAFPDRYRVRGAFVLKEDAGDVIARPEFPAEKFRVRLDLTPGSWEKVEAALRSQDTFAKCGMAIDPPAILPKLRELAAAGFEFKLPRSIFRSVAMPAQVRSRVEVQGNQVDVAVDPKVMRLTKEYLWYAASLKARIMVAATASPTPRPRKRK